MTTDPAAQSSKRDHASLVQEQFSPQAQAYLQSEVHAKGDDLERIQRLLSEYPQAEVLDLGCGGGHVSYAAAPLAHRVTAYDLSPEMLATVQAEAAKRGLNNLETVAGPAEKLPFAGSSFDLVISRYSAHHWRDLPQAIKEIWRVLRSSGVLLLVDVISPGVPELDVFLQTIEMLRDPSHIRDYSAGSWLRIVANASLRVDRMKTFRLPLDFASWTKRQNTPEVFSQAILGLQGRVSSAVQEYFELSPQGDFTVDVIVLEARKW